MLGIALTVVVRRQWPVDRNLVKVRTAEAADLSIGVGKQSALQQRIIGKVDARNDMPGAEGDLFGFGEEIVRVTVEHHLAQWCHRHQLFRDDLGRVEQVEVKFMLILFGDDLHTELPLRIIAGLDCFPEVAAMVVGVLAGQFLCFIPKQRTDTSLGLPVEFDEARLAFSVYQPEGMHTKALHGAQAFRNGPVRHRPDHHVRRLRHQRDKVPEGVMS
ncbi:hypothetical protein D3C81_1282840 [compost metagenome]